MLFIVAVATEFQFESELTPVQVDTLTKGERNAADSKSGKSVHQSDPGLRRPTPPATAGRKPGARPPVLLNPDSGVELFESREAGLSQPKTGRGAGQSPAILREREALTLESLDEESVRQIISFFELLDCWDREAHAI